MKPSIHISDGAGHRFASAREAIDAVSSFENKAICLFQYDIQHLRSGWTVEVRDEAHDRVGFLAVRA